MICGGTKPITPTKLVAVAVSYSDEIPHLVEVVREAFSDGLPDPPPWVASLPLVGEWLDGAWRELVGNRAQVAETCASLEPIDLASVARGGNQRSA